MSDSSSGSEWGESDYEEEEKGSDDNEQETDETEQVLGKQESPQQKGMDWKKPDISSSSWSSDQGTGPSGEPSDLERFKIKETGEGARGYPAPISQSSTSFRRPDEPGDDYRRYMHDPTTAKYYDDDRPWTWRKVGVTSWPKNVEEDLPIFRGIGLNIDYSEQGRIGEGTQGMVFRGRYGRELHGIGDIVEGMEFAVKIIDFKQDLVLREAMRSLRTGEQGALQEDTENEKFIVTNTQHENIVDVKFVFNMGEQRILTFMNAPANTYICSERVYIFMEISDGGELDKWTQSHRNELDVVLKIMLVRDLFQGLMYLHTNHIVHNDIHSGNVLMFSARLTRNNRWTAKYVDFGCGYVSERGNQYIYKRAIPEHEFEEKLRGDIRRMAFVMQTVITSGNSSSPSINETNILERMKSMVEEIMRERPYNIMTVFQKFRDLL